MAVPVTASQLDLSGDEVKLLVKELMEWGGPAHCTEEFAAAMGFASVERMLSEVRQISSQIRSNEAMPSLDWVRALLCTEIAFISDVVGSGFEWSTTTGWSDSRTIPVLRSMQRKLAPQVASVVGVQLGTRTIGRVREGGE